MTAVIQAGGNNGLILDTGWNQQVFLTDWIWGECKRGVKGS